MYMLQKHFIFLPEIRFVSTLYLLAEGSHQYNARSLYYKVSKKGNLLFFLCDKDYDSGLRAIVDRAHNARIYIWDVRYCR